MAIIAASAVYYLSATMLALLNLASVFGTAVGLPGNWLMVLLAATFAWFFPATQLAEGVGGIGVGGVGAGIGWPVVGVLLVLAVLGEVAEFAAGAFGAAQQGASRKSMALSLAGAMLGSLGGSLMGLPIPVFGSVVAGLLGGAVGAFAGAYAGEYLSGATREKSWRVSRSAVVGRFLGTAGKLIAGTIMLVIITIATFL